MIIIFIMIIATSIIIAVPLAIDWGSEPNKKSARIVRINGKKYRKDNDLFDIEVKTNLFGWKSIDLEEYLDEIHTPELINGVKIVSGWNNGKYNLLGTQEEAELFCQQLLRHWKKGFHKSKGNIVTKTYEIE